MSPAMNGSRFWGVPAGSSPLVPLTLRGLEGSWERGGLWGSGCCSAHRNLWPSFLGAGPARGFLRWVCPRFRLWVDPQWGPCAPTARPKMPEPWHLSTRGGRPLPGEHSFHLHKAAQLPRACWAQVANSSPICVISGAGGGVPAGPAPLRCQPPPPPPWGAGTRWASPLSSPEVTPAVGPAPPLGLCVLCLTG